MMRAIIVAACFIVAACGATAPAGTNGIAATSTPFVRPTVASTSATSDVTPEPEPTDTPDAGPSEVKLGESVRITCDGQDCMDVVVLKDTTVTIEAGKKYTALLWGNARPGQTPAMRLSFLEDAPPDPGTNIALRVINTTGSAIDVRQYISTGTLPTAASWSNVGPLSVSSYLCRNYTSWRRTC